MNVSLLDFPKVHPPIHTPRFSARFRTQGSNTPQVGSFKNPLLGVEINLLKQIQDIESLHKPTSKRKKVALLNALEDAANIDYGFKRQILYALSMLRPQNEEEENEENEIFRMTAAKDLLSTRHDYSEISKDKEKIDKRISKLKEKLKMIDEEEKQMKIDIVDMKNKLFSSNHKYERFRNIKNKLEVIQTAFDEMFKNPYQEDVDPSVSDLVNENEKLRKKIMKLKYELFTVNQISRRIKFIDNQKDEEDDDY